MKTTLRSLALFLLLLLCTTAQADGWIELTNISTMNSTNPPPSEVTALASNSTYLFAASSPDAVRRSADGGASWQYGINAFYISAMTANDAHLFTADKYGNVYRYEYDGSNRSSFGRLPDITGYSRIPTSMRILGDYLFVSTRGGKYFKRALYELSGVTPTAAAATSIGTAVFTAGWSSSTGDLGYRLDVATDAAFTALVAGYNNKDIGNVTSFEVTGLVSNTTYYYRMRAYNAYGTSNNSSTVTLLTNQN